MAKFNRLGLGVACGSACLLLAGAGRGLALDAASSNWEIMLWTDPVTVSVDTASIAPYERWLTARVLWDYAEPRDDGSGAYRSMVGVVVVDCATRRLGGAGATSYAGDGGDGDAVAGYSIPPERAALGDSSPGTIGRDLVSYVCAHDHRHGASAELSAPTAPDRTASAGQTSSSTPATAERPRTRRSNKS